MEPASTSPTPTFPSLAPVTWGLIAINILTFAAMLKFENLNSPGFSVAPSYETLIFFGAKENGLIALGEIWRIFTPMFLHANFLHIGFNMYGLYYVGRFLEAIIGSKKTLLVYIFGGITGNLCSFSLTSKLSVGASSSLFAFLLCLYVIQKYEENLAKEHGLSAPKTNLGSLLIANALLSFIPAIDWASHLGGAIAGGLIGTAICFNHKKNMRLLRASHYLSPSSSVYKPKFLENPTFYLASLFIINILFCSTYLQVTRAEKIWGLGLELASTKKNPPKSNSVLSSYSDLINAPKSEANPRYLLVQAVFLHEKKQYLSALRIYEVLQLYSISEIKNELFNNLETQSFIENAAYLAANKQPLDEISLVKFLENEKSDPNVCLKAANLLEKINFYYAAGLLYECAFFSDVNNLTAGASVIEMYWRENAAKPLQEFRTNLDFLESKKSFTWFKIRQNPDLPHDNSAGEHDDSYIKL